MVIKKFYLNREKNIIYLCNDLKNFISNFTNDQIISKYIDSLSKDLDIPRDVIKNEMKIILFKNFENEYGKFNRKFSLSKIILFILRYLALGTYSIIFSEKIKPIKKNFDVIIDDIDSYNSPERFFNLENFYKLIYICNRSIKKKNQFIYKRFIKHSSDIIFINKPLKLIKIFCFTLYYSCKSSNNLFPFIIEFINTIIKYETVFKKFKSKFLIQERHYNISELKNYIFKSNNGRICCATQKNILQINGIGMYMYSDILFTLGTKTAENLQFYASQVKKKVPIGSLAMELNYHKRKDKNKTKKFDLLVFASDHDKIFHSGYNSYYDEYMTHFDWIKKLALKFPNYKIGIKLKKVINDNNVIAKFENVKNVMFVFDKDKYSDSYYLAENAKSLCTWSSTLAFEFLGAGRLVFFLDPNYKNISFLPNYSFIKKLKINNYEKFQKKIIGQIKNKSSRFFYNKALREKFCLESKNSSKNIFLALQDLEKKKISF